MDDEHLEGMLKCSSAELPCMDRAEVLIVATVYRDCLPLLPTLGVLDSHVVLALGLNDVEVTCVAVHDTLELDGQFDFPSIVLIGAVAASRAAEPSLAHPRPHYKLSGGGLEDCVCVHEPTEAEGEEGGECAYLEHPFKLTERSSLHLAPLMHLEVQRG